MNANAPDGNEAVVVGGEEGAEDLISFRMIFSLLRKCMWFYPHIISKSQKFFVQLSQSISHVTLSGGPGEDRNCRTA